MLTCCHCLPLSEPSRSLINLYCSVASNRRAEQFLKCIIHHRDHVSKHRAALNRRRSCSIRLAILLTASLIASVMLTCAWHALVTVSVMSHFLPGIGMLLPRYSTCPPSARLWSLSCVTLVQSLSWI